LSGENQVKDQDWDDCEAQRREDGDPVGYVLPDELLNTQRNCLRAVPRRKDQGEQQIIQDPDHGKDGDGCNGTPNKRKEKRKTTIEHPTPETARGCLQNIGDLKQESRHAKDRHQQA